MTDFVGILKGERSFIKEHMSRVVDTTRRRIQTHVAFVAIVVARERYTSETVDQTCFEHCHEEKDNRHTQMFSERYS